MGLFDGLLHAAATVQHGISRGFAQINPLDNGRTWQNPQGNAPQQAITHTPAPSAWQQFTPQVNHVGTGLGLGAVRSGVGTAQGLSGLYDLLTPGNGTNRFSKSLDNYAQTVDQTAAANNVGAAYNIGQTATDALTFLTPGAIAKVAGKVPMAVDLAGNATKYIPKFADIVKPGTALERATTAISDGASGATTAINNGVRGGKYITGGVKAAARPSNLGNAVVGTALDQGAQASKGRQVTPTSVLTSAAGNVIGGGALHVAGAVASDAAHGITTAIKDGIHSYAEAHPVYADHTSVEPPSAPADPAPKPTPKSSNAAAPTTPKPVAGDVIPSAKDRPFDSHAVGEAAAKAQEVARTAGNPVGVKQKLLAAKDKFMTAMVDNTDGAEKSTRQAINKGVKINPVHNLIYQIDRVLRTDSLSGHYMHDLGLPKLIGSMTKKEFNTAGEYSIAKRHIETFQGKKGLTGRDPVKDRALIADVEANHPKIVDAHKQLMEINQRMLHDQHHGIQEGQKYNLISKETLAHLQKHDPMYASFNRIFSEHEHVGAKGGSTSVASNSTNELMRHIKGSQRVIENPFKSALINAQKLVEHGERNRAGAALARTMKLDGNPNMIRALRTAANVTKRINLYTKAKDLRPVQNKIERTLKTKGKEAGDLQRQLNKYNEQGKNLSLAKDRSKIDKPILSAQHEILSGATKMNSPMRDIPKLSGTVTHQLTTRSQTSKEVRDMMHNLVNMNDSELNKVLKKIDNRNGKLTPLLKEIQSHRTEVQAIKQERAQLLQDGRQAADLKSSSGNTFSVINGGVKEIYEASPAVIKAAKNLTAEQVGFVGKILQHATRLLRLGATGVNVGFAAVNLPRDIVSAFINSDHPFKTSIANPNVFVSSMKAAFNHKSAEYGELVREGASGTSFDIARGAEHRSIEKLQSQHNTGTRLAYAARHPIHSAADLLRAVENTIGRSEEFTRALQYYGTKEAKLGQGFAPHQARILAADASRNNTVNFARHGDIGRVLNTVVPYLNAGFQGSRTLVRNLKNKPAETISKIAVTALLPAATVTAWNLSDPKRRDIYNQLSPTDKTNSLIIVTDKAKRDPKTGLITGVIRVPMSQEIASLANIVSNGVEAMKGDKNFDWKAMTDNLFNSGTGLSMSGKNAALNTVLPQGVKPFVEAATNTNLYTGNTIVPDAMKNLDKKDQYNSNTSGTALTIGKMTGVSPMIIDNFIKTSTGGGGQQAVNFIDHGLATAGVTDKNRIGGKDLIHSATDRFDTAHSQSDGAIAFNSLQQAAVANHLAGRSYELLNAIASKEMDGNGKPKLTTEQDTFTINSILAHNSDVAKVKAEAAVAAAKASGKPLDPLYKLTADQQQQYYIMHSVPRGGEDYRNAFVKNEAWLTPLATARSQFYKDNPIIQTGKDGKVIMGADGKPAPVANDKIPYPIVDDTSAALEKSFFSLDNPGKKAFIQAHPEIKAIWKNSADYTNKVRVATGFTPLVERPQPSAAVQANLDAGNFKDSATTAYLNQANLFTINREGSLATLQGNPASQKELKAISGLGKYGEVKNPDGTLAVAGSDQAQAGAVSTKGFGGGGHSGGRTKGITKIKNLRSPHIKAFKAPNTHIASYTSKPGKIPRYQPYNPKLAQLNKPRKKTLV